MLCFYVKNSSQVVKVVKSCLSKILCDENMDSRSWTVTLDQSRLTWYVILFSWRPSRILDVIAILFLPSGLLPGQHSELKDMIRNKRMIKDAIMHTFSAAKSTPTALTNASHMISSHAFGTGWQRKKAERLCL